MSLIDLIIGRYKVVSVVGMAKNAGKTVTLNSIIDEASDRDIILGITSTGRDGEREDIVTETEKPLIYVQEGTLIATTDEALPLGDARVEVMITTDYGTPMGNVIIGKVISSGYIQIAGPQTSRGIRDVSNTMLQLGAELVLIDGAINRISSAAPAISDGVILATGAVLSRDMNKVIEETIHTIRLFGLMQLEDFTVRDLVEEAMSDSKIAVIDRDFTMRYLDIKTAINSGSIIADNIKEKTTHVVLPGSLVKKTVEDIIKITNEYKDVTFIVRDGTKVFIDSRDWLIFKKQGFKVEALDSIKTIAITLNSSSPQGYYFNQVEFLDRMKKYITDIPIIDVMMGGE